MTHTEMLERLNRMDQLLAVIETRFKKDQEEITRLKSFGCELNKNYIRLDDPVVAGLVEALRRYHAVYGLGYGSLEANKALSAYEARVKEVSRE